MLITDNFQLMSQKGRGPNRVNVDMHACIMQTMFSYISEPQGLSGALAAPPTGPAAQSLDTAGTEKVGTNN